MGYDRSASVYDAIYQAKKDYRQESERLRELIEHNKGSSGNRLLDVACGTGLHAQFLRQWYDVEGLDLSHAQLAVARRRLPDVALHRRDMSHFDLGRSYGAVTCLFSAIGHLTTIAELLRGVAAMAGHLEPGGVLVVEPRLHPDAFESGRNGAGGHHQLNGTQHSGELGTEEPGEGLVVGQPGPPLRAHSTPRRTRGCTRQERLPRPLSIVVAEWPARESRRSFVGEMVSFSSNGDSAEGYLALPESGEGPGVVLIQEWWGLVPHIRDVADRLAAEGFVTLAPDVFHGAKTTEPDEAMRLLMGLAMDRAGRDIAGAASYLAGRPESTGTGIGAVGFCMGGSLALWSATLSDDVRAVAGFYPAMPWERMSPTWSRYDGKAAVIHTDAHEGGSQGEGVQQAKTAIEAAGGEVTLYDYPGTEHAFFNDTRPEVYNPQAAREAWARTTAFLRDRLVA